MKAKLFRLSGLVLVLALGSVALADDSVIIPPDQVEAETGMTYGEWQAAWWQWAFSQHAIGGPLYDWTGADAAKGQSGDVWFLCGIYGVDFAPQTNPAVVHRDITIPEGKFLFAPILNVETNVLEGTAEDELFNYVTWVLTLAQDMEFTVDGETLSDDDLADYGAVAPELFNISMPEGNNISSVDRKDWPKPVQGRVIIEDCAASGFGVMVEPLSVGKHTIHFQGAFVLGDWSFALDITYDITVAPKFPPGRNK